jgi:hypothetical protein
MVIAAARLAASNPPKNDAERFGEKYFPLSKGLPQ